MATYEYDDFRVTFSPVTDGEDGRYSLRVACTGGADLAGEFVAPTGDELAQLVLGVANNRAALRTRRASAPAKPVPALVGADEPPTTRALGANLRREVDGAELGARLAAGLFSGDVGTAYRDALQRVQGQPRGVRLTLSLAGAPKLQSLPWEFLKRGKLFLASQRHTPVVRQHDTGTRVAPPQISDMVKVLAVVSGPTDLPRLDVEKEKANIQAALQAVTAMERVEVTWLETANRASLREALLQDTYHILHYVGHSDFKDGKGWLFLEHADRRSDPVDTDWLANVVSDARHLRLAVFNSCEGARTTVDDPYAGIAMTLLEVGVPAVVAMQFEISDEVAVFFAGQLYTNLIARQIPVDAAVAEARKAVLSDLQSSEFATPVLFVQDPDVALFEFRRAAEADLPPLPPPAVGPEGHVPLRLHRTVRSRWFIPTLLLGIACSVFGLLVLIELTSPGVLEPGSDVTAPTTTALPNATGFPSLELGAGGPTVEAAQLLLTAHGFPVDATGRFDGATADAIRAFDTASGFPPDHILGALTWSELVKVVRRGSTGPAVEAAQLLLNVNGAVLDTDAVFGPDTEAATVAFENAHDLRADGIVDIDVWRLLTANAVLIDDTADEPLPPEDTVVVTVPAVVVDPTEPRPPSGHLAFVVEESDGVHLRSVDPDQPAFTPVRATTRAGVTDRDPAWQPGTNRLAFSRVEPNAGADVGVFYVVPGTGQGDLGKTVDRLVTGRNGTERLPAWAADGGLFYVATDTCLPDEPTCADSLRVAHFTVSDEQGVEGGLGYYKEDVLSQDTLTLSGDKRLAPGLANVSAIAAHPVDPERAVLLDDEGLWIVDDTTPTLVQPGLVGDAISYSATGTSIVVAGPSGLTLLDETGAIRSTATVAELAAATTASTTIAPESSVASIDLANTDGRLVAFIDDGTDGLPAVLATLVIGGDSIAITDVQPIPPAVYDLGSVLGVTL